MTKKDFIKLAELCKAVGQMVDCNIDDRSFPRKYYRSWDVTEAFILCLKASADRFDSAKFRLAASKKDI